MGRCQGCSRSPLSGMCPVCTPLPSDTPPPGFCISVHSKSGLGLKARKLLILHPKNPINPTETAFFTSEVQQDRVDATARPARRNRVETFAKAPLRGGNNFM